MGKKSKSNKDVESVESTGKELTGNKELNKMLVTISEAKKKGAKKVVVFTTNRSHHKAKLNEMGFGVHDLKPKFLEAYKYLLCKYDVMAKLININEMAVEWIVKFK